VRRFYWFLPAALLAACGGSPPEPPPATPQETAVAPVVREDPRPVIAAFGDSLTEGLGVDPSRSYPELLQGHLDRRGYRYRVVNLGVSGDTTSGGVARLDGVLSLKPAVVILELGANDGLRGLPVAQTRANLEKMIAAIAHSGARVVLAGMTLPPNYGPDYIRPFEAVYRELAAKYNATFIPFFLDGVAGDARYMQRDGLHPNAAGYERVAANVMRALEPALRNGAPPS
jgi:acyl-CoA thioesterase-1